MLADRASAAESRHAVPRGRRASDPATERPLDSPSKILFGKEDEDDTRENVAVSEKRDEKATRRAHAVELVWLRHAATRRINDTRGRAQRREYPRTLTHDDALPRTTPNRVRTSLAAAAAPRHSFPGCRVT